MLSRVRWLGCLVSQSTTWLMHYIMCAVKSEMMEDLCLSTSLVFPSLAACFA